MDSYYCALCDETTSVNSKTTHDKTGSHSKKSNYITKNIYF